MQGQAVRGALSEAGFSGEMILANLRKLRSLVESLDWDGAEGTWAQYEACDHVLRDRDDKTDFLASALEAVSPVTMLDLGANDGHFSRLAVEKGAAAVSVDGDEAVLDHLYRTLERGTRLTPVLADLSNPSPAQGWAGVERPALFDRARADLVVAYGLIHHLIYTASVPPRRVVEWLAGFDVPVVVEFVGPDDPMVDRLTANKRPDELHPQRDRDSFERLVGAHFEIADRFDLAGGTRRLYRLVR